MFKSMSNMARALQQTEKSTGQILQIARPFPLKLQQTTYFTEPGTGYNN